jgi:hypothetical protein
MYSSDLSSEPSGAKAKSERAAKRSGFFEYLQSAIVQ